jgi:hypothetical protein
LFAAARGEDAPPLFTSPETCLTTVPAFPESFPVILGVFRGCFVNLKLFTIIFVYFFLNFYNLYFVCKRKKRKKYSESECVVYIFFMIKSQRIKKNLIF